MCPFLHIFFPLGGTKFLDYIIFPLYNHSCQNYFKEDLMAINFLGIISYICSLIF